MVVQRHGAQARRRSAWRWPQPRPCPGGGRRHRRAHPALHLREGVDGIKACISVEVVACAALPRPRDRRRGPEELSRICGPSESSCYWERRRRLLGWEGEDGHCELATIVADGSSSACPPPTPTVDPGPHW